MKLSVSSKFTGHVYKLLKPWKL